LADRLVIREANFWISEITWRKMPVPTNVMSPSADTVGHALKQARTAMGFTLKQVPASPTTRLLGYGKEEEPPDIVPRQYKYLACKAYEMKLISFEKLAELLRRNYYELREEFEQGSQ
jgi:hypothetical protein